jgi:AraC-like DNA-binding protein
MSFVYEEREADSPVVRTVWRTRSESDGVYTASADGCWDLLVVKQGRTASVLLAGPSSRATPIPYVAGSEYLGIRLRLGTFPRHLSAGRMLDRTILLPKVGERGFWLGDSAWEIPTYDDVETLVARLVRSDLLLRDSVVSDTLARASDPALSARTVQRHFLRTTGLTRQGIRQIERARRAVDLLQRGTPIPVVAHEAGYSDQPHLTRSLRRFIGKTPGQVLAAGVPEADPAPAASPRTHW